MIAIAKETYTTFKQFSKTQVQHSPILKSNLKALHTWIKEQVSQGIFDHMPMAKNFVFLDMLKDMDIDAYSKP